MNIKPFNDCILIELIESDAESQVVVVNDSPHNSITQGVVIEVATDTEWINTPGGPVMIQALAEQSDLIDADNRPGPGDVVYIRKYSDQDSRIERDGKKFALIRWNDIMGFTPKGDK